MDSFAHLVHGTARIGPEQTKPRAASQIAASSDELRQGFEEHLEQKGHVQRLDEIFEALGESPRARNAKAWLA